MKKKLLKFLFLLINITVAYGAYGSENYSLTKVNYFDLSEIETTIDIPQNINEAGLVIVSGNIVKKITSNNIELKVQYLDSNNNWITKWSRNFSAQTIINENLDAFFELPPSGVNIQKIKILFVSQSGTISNDDVVWDKSISHYNYGDYTMNTSCTINESNYTILITPKDENTLVHNIQGNIVGVKDRVNSQQIFNKKQTLFTINKPATIISENGRKGLRIVNNGNLDDILAHTPEINYSDTVGRPLPYLYSYNDPVYVFAGKFSSNGFKLKFSQWPGDVDGPGYHDFSNPNQLVSRYFNLYNTINQKLSELISDQEPVVFVSSKLTGFRVYKQDGTIIKLSGYNNYNPTSAYFGYPADQGGGERGPGSENFIISKTNDITIFGMGAIANRDIISNNDKPIHVINTEIQNFINYTEVFNNNKCFTISPNTMPNYTDKVDENVLAAPNSYIYDLNLALSNNYGGINIPVKKAYDVWRNSNGDLKNEIPNGVLSASVVWQDKESLINNVSITGQKENAKIKVDINPTKGKGNAVVSLHVGVNGNDSDPVYWSWHIWITDDPTQNTITYTNNGDNRMVNTFMDRNLGALSDDFLGEDWNKSGGLLYQWGRKDPFPAMRYTDETLLKFYIKNNEEINNNNFLTKLVKSRPYNLLNENLKYTIQNPLYFISTERAGAWFASLDNNKKIKGNDGYAVENYDLWGDNNKGVTKKESFEKQVKSPYDPCPSGWRVPSFAHSESTIPIYSPWGSINNYNIGDNHNLQTITETNNRYPNARFYLRMGVDFKEGSDNYNIGRYSLTGGYKRSEAGNVLYQDNYAESNIWSATLRSNVQGRNFHIINDPDQPGGRYLVNPFQEASTSEGYAVRCTKDNETNLLFNTEYFITSKRNYTEGIENPNSYILYTNREVNIPVNKAYAVYNQVLTDQEWIPAGQQTSNVFWTTNTALIKSLDVSGVGENATINVKLNDNQYGNAVVSLHIGNQGNSTDPVFWSWHIWAPKSNPEINTNTYLSDKSTPSSFKVYNTNFGFPPMKTEFMDRPLGSIETYDLSQGTNISSEAFSMLYQWGRKDPMPSFFSLSWFGRYPIYTGNRVNGTIQYIKLADDIQYTVDTRYFKENLQNSLSANEIKKFSIQNPLTHLLNTSGGANDWLSNKANLEKERWGHASKKSIYDPCPSGWRVPDFGFNTNINSPWGKASLYTINAKKELFASTKLSDYKISRTFVQRSPNLTTSFVALDPLYKIGFLPAIGFRSKKYTNNNIGGVVSTTNFVYASNVWSATMIPNYDGYAFGLDTYDNIHLVHNTVHPTQGRSVVCSKDVTRFSEEYFQNLNSQPKNSYETILKTNGKTISENEIYFYPNPVETILKTNFNESLKVEVYKISGEKVLEGQFVNQQLNISKLTSGIYVLVLENGKSYKVIKK